MCLASVWVDMAELLKGEAYYFLYLSYHKAAKGPHQDASTMLSEASSHQNHKTNKLVYFLKHRVLGFC